MHRCFWGGDIVSERSFLDLGFEGIVVGFSGCNVLFMFL